MPLLPGQLRCWNGHARIRREVVVVADLSQGPAATANSRANERRLRSPARSQPPLVCLDKTQIQYVSCSSSPLGSSATSAEMRWCSASKPVETGAEVEPFKVVTVAPDAGLAAP